MSSIEIAWIREIGFNWEEWQRRITESKKSIDLYIVQTENWRDTLFFGEKEIDRRLKLEKVFADTARPKDQAKWGDSREEFQEVDEIKIKPKKYGV